MSADILRRAAAALREHAGTASPGPWRSVGGVVESQLPDGHGIVDGYNCETHPGRAAADADYIALLHPPVALALADWLDETANHITKFAAVAGLVRADDLTEVDNAALAAVRAILREETS